MATLEEVIEEIRKTRQEFYRTPSSAETMEIRISVEMLDDLWKFLGELRDIKDPKKEPKWKNPFYNNDADARRAYESAFNWEEIYRQAQEHMNHSQYYQYYQSKDYQSKDYQYAPPPPPPPEPETRTWWKVLGLQPNAKRPQIIKAYRSLAMRFHPDRPHGNAQKMQEINVARDQGLSGL